MADWQAEVKGLQRALEAVERAMDEIESEEAYRALSKQRYDIQEQSRHTGPFIPDSPGVSRPGWMDDDEWAEYQMSAEYAYEVRYEPSEDPLDYYDDFGGE